MEKLERSKRKRQLRFKGRKKSGNGIASIVIGVIGWILFIALSVFSTKEKGMAGSVVGILGIFDALLIGTGMFYAIKGFQERDVFYLYPIIGMAANAILFLILFYLFLMGMAV